MPELKRIFTAGKMNKDVDERLVPKGEYVDALNIEVRTSESSEVGTVQTLKGNSTMSNYFNDSTSNTCVGTIADEKNNKIYWFVSGVDINSTASTTYTHESTAVTHNIYSDYILEYDESPELYPNTPTTDHIFVEHYKVTTNVVAASTPTSTTNYISLSPLGASHDPKKLGIQPGMDLLINNYRLKVTYISRVTASPNTFRVHFEYPNGGIGAVSLGQSVTFELKKEKRALGFSNFALENPKKLITGINIIDGLLFWTDGLTEPKKINIERCRYGTSSAAYNTFIIVNGEKPSSSNYRLADPTSYSSVLEDLPMTYKETSVIKKSPTTAPKLIMSNTNRADLTNDNYVKVNTTVSLTQQNTSSFFFADTGELLPFGETTPTLLFPDAMDWQEGDIVDFYPEDEDAGVENDVLITAEIATVSAGGLSFTFRIISISSSVTKLFTTYKVKLKQEEPLFEFKFPRFAYRWKYEDGEYSCYSPFSDVAFLPDEFDYLPKKGYNLGMTNNLRYLLIYGFKPVTMPLDVVEIDILYKEANSPNVYTVKTIKSPSTRVETLNTFAYEGDKSWQGKVKGRGATQFNDPFVEFPNSLTTHYRLVSTTEFEGIYDSPTRSYVIKDSFEDINIKEGDKIEFQDTFSDAPTAPVIIGSVSSNNAIIPFIDTNGEVKTKIKLLENTSSALQVSSASWFADGVKINILRETAGSQTIPAINIDHPQGSLEITSDIIHATVPANQLLRPFDNVPTKALAQEMTGNRIVYGNYTQNYDLVDEGNTQIKPSFDFRLTKRSNIIENVRYDEATTLQSQTTGAVVNWYDPENSILEQPSLPERSLKSIRDYQLGVVYLDEFGRQTPVQTHETGTLKIKKENATTYNEFRLKLTDNLMGSTPVKPYWATHYKYYIKENANEYYNLAMDRFYSAEDGNIWLSFPSSERNKVDEETFLILKKQHDNNTAVTDKDSRYKILAIENEAPLFVKTKLNSFGIISTVFGASGQPKIQQMHVDVNSNFFDEGGTFESAVSAKERVIRISNANNISAYYDVVSINSYSGNFHRITVNKKFDTDMSFTTDDGTNSGNINSNLSIEIAEREVKNLPEFEGRFFVKIYKDAVFEKNILSLAPDKEHITTEAVKLAFCKGNDNGSTLAGDFWGFGGLGGGSSTPWSGWSNKAWFVDRCIAHAQQSSTEPSDSHGKHGLGLHANKTKLDIAFSWFDPDSLGPWDVASSPDPGVTLYDKTIAKLLKTNGTLFRFKGDTTVYKIIGTTYTQSIYNYTKRPHRKKATNHRQRFIVNVSPPIGENVDSLGNPIRDAVGEEASGYNPFDSNFEGSSNVDNSPWQNVSDDWKNDSNRNRTIEFLEEFTSDSSYSSDNPAIWETEPKENIDVDIYNEASDSLPIDYEWNSYLNMFVKHGFFGSFNATNYYNCFSFANGVESNRIRDDFNAQVIDKGPKVSTVLAEQYQEEQRKSGLIYSGIYNSTSGVNNLNQFIAAEKITKDINPTYGSIQKLYSKETNLTALCEDRIIRILANKDALFNADGNANVTSTSNVLGAATPYSGDFGISTNPESFAADQYRAYFTDKARGAVIRLSRDGITPISDAGMADFFKDVLKSSNISLIGSYDKNKKLYNITMKEGPNTLLKPNATEVVSGDGLDFIDYIETNHIGYFELETGTTVEGGEVGMFDDSGSVVAPSSSTIQNITNITLNQTDYFSRTAVSNLITAFEDCPDGSVYLHYHVLHGTPLGEYSTSPSLKPNGAPIVTYLIKSITTSGTNQVFQVEFTSGSYAVIDYAHFWWSTEGCDVGFGGDPSIQNSVANDLGFTQITASFSENAKGWTTFQSWLQECGVSLNNKYFTYKGAELYEHYKNETRNNFYGTQYESSISMIFNDAPSSVKNFGYLSYEGTQSKVTIPSNYQTDGLYHNHTAKDGWYASYISTNLETGYIPEFIEKEGKWFNYISGNQDNTLANLDVSQFSTQGIGVVQSVLTNVNPSDKEEKFTLIIKDTGDTD